MSCGLLKRQDAGSELDTASGSGRRLLLSGIANHIRNDMSVRRYNLPSASAIIAFEAVARLQGFGRAAQELNTSQPAISRHIRNLEIRYGTTLFLREGGRSGSPRRGGTFMHPLCNRWTGCKRR